MTAGIAGHQDLGSGLSDILQLAIQNLLACVSKLQTEGCCRPTTPGGLFHFPKLHSGNALNQLARLFTDPLCMAQMAGFMIGDALVYLFQRFSTYPLFA